MAPELKLIGGMRGDRINRRAPIPRDGPPAPPAHLSPDQRRIFRQITAELVGMRVRCAPDRLIVESLAVMVDWSRRACAEMEENGAWGPGARGGEVATPAWRIYRDSTREIARLSAELGLTPAARNRVVTGAEPGSDWELEKLLSQ